MNKKNLKQKKVLRVKKKLLFDKKVLGIAGAVVIVVLAVLAFTNYSGISNFLLGRTVEGTATLSEQNTNIHIIPPQKDPNITNGNTFTLDYAKAYILAHPFHNGVTTTGQASTIDQIYFTTVDQAKVLTHGIWFSKPSNDQVLVVIEKGPFLLDNTTWPDGHIPTAQAVIRIFDAHTGYRFMWGEWRG